MITGAIKTQVDRIWDAFWSGGISNPLEVMEQITYLLFLRRLDDLHTLAENKAARLNKPMERRVFPKGQDDIGKNGGRPYEDLPWSHFKHLAPSEMFAVVGEHVFPFLRTLGGDDSTYAHHMKDARFTIPTPALLAKVVDLLDGIPMEDRDTKGDLYEYMLGKIASAGQNGQFRTPRHIIQLMVEIAAPQRSCWADPIHSFKLVMSPIATATSGHSRAPTQMLDFDRARCGQRARFASPLPRILQRPVSLHLMRASLTALSVLALRTRLPSNLFELGSQFYKPHLKPERQNLPRRTLILKFFGVSTSQHQRLSSSGCLPIASRLSRQ